VAQTQSSNPVRPDEREAIAFKRARLRDGHPPRVLDLFSGCGGLTLGFSRAGCEVIAGVELDPHAARSHALNFHRGAKHFDLHAEPVDITTTGPLELLQRFGCGEPMREVDLLVGGPPCPAFTRVGRAKLREVHDHPEAFRHDPRAKLYLPYLQYVEALRPLALLMENVPDILNFGGHNLGEEISEILEALGYGVSYTLLNAASYGVPQMRERFYLVAVHADVAEVGFSFPSPSRHVVFPRGYEGSREVALKQVRSGDLFAARSHYVEPPSPGETRLPPPVSAREAIEDLPQIMGHLDGSLRRGARRFDSPVSYRPDVQLNPYAKEMREWPGFESTGVLWDHVTRSLSARDYRLFRAMNPGDEYPAARALAERLFEHELERLRECGVRVLNDSQEVESLRAAFVPPYDASKFPNKWRKMEPDQPARTLMAHLGKDSYSHIHYDGLQARVISVREAARLQSFPDGFVFSGTMNPAFRQIGNAVPPLMAHALAREILSSLGIAKARIPANVQPQSDRLRAIA
jgi:DNA (cytosine-5)-methyltransferase 1